MAQNYIQAGSRLDYTVPSGQSTTTGVPVVIGETVGIALNSGAAGSQVVIAFDGVYTLAKATGSGTAIALGARLYWDATNNRVTGTPGTHKMIGFAWSAAAVGDATVQVKLASGTAPA